MRGRAAFLAATLLVSLSGKGDAAASNTAVAAARTIPVMVQTAAGSHRFMVEVARTSAEQKRGLMYRTNLTADGGMIFAPYPPESGAPADASFWMQNTPTSLDIIFIRSDGTIANIAQNTVPYSEESLRSEGPVSAVLEIVGGRSAELGIAPGDRVTWPR